MRFEGLFGGLFGRGERVIATLGIDDASFFDLGAYLELADGRLGQPRGRMCTDSLGGDRVWRVGSQGLAGRWRAGGESEVARELMGRGGNRVGLVWGKCRTATAVGRVGGVVVWRTRVRIAGRVRGV